VRTNKCGLAVYLGGARKKRAEFVAKTGAIKRIYTRKKTQEGQRFQPGPVMLDWDKKNGKR